MLTVKTEELKQSLERVVLLIKERSQADELVGKVSYKEGRFWCKTEDTRAALEVSFLDGLEDFCIDGMDLYRYLQRVTDEEVSLEKGENLLVKGKRTKAEFACFEPFLFDLPKKWKTIGPQFLETLADASKFVSKSFYRPVLTAVCVAGNTMQGTDSLLYYKVTGAETFMLDKETLIPGASVPFIQLLAPDHFFIDDNIMYFKQKPSLIGACSLLSGEYPAVTRMLEDKKQGVQITFGDDAKEAVSRCSVFVEYSRFEEEKKIFVTLAKNQARLSVKSSIGQNKENIKAKYDKSLEGTSFCLRPDFFAEILSKGTTCLLCPKSIQIVNDKIWVVSALISRN